MSNVVRHTSGRNFARATSRSFETLSHWTQTLHGQGELREALCDLCRLVGGDLAIVARHSLSLSKIDTIAVVDVDEGKLFSVRNPCSFGQRILEASGLSARSGTVWILSRIREEGDVDLPDRLLEELKERSIRDIAVIALGGNSDVMDFLEIQFRSEFKDHDQVLLTTLASALVKSWNSRLPGTCQTLLSRSRFARSSASFGSEVFDILAEDNPLGLSRSEYRICAMIRSGMLTSQVAKQLGIQESTIRSHLRAIYAKTETSGQVDLVHRLARRAV